MKHNIYCHWQRFFLVLLRFNSSTSSCVCCCRNIAILIIISMKILTYSMTRYEFHVIYLNECDPPCFEGLLLRTVTSNRWLHPSLLPVILTLSLLFPGRSSIPIPESDGVWSKNHDRILLHHVSTLKPHWAIIRFRPVRTSSLFSLKPSWLTVWVNHTTVTLALSESDTSMATGGTEWWHLTRFYRSSWDQ